MTFVDHMMAQCSLWAKDPLIDFAARPKMTQWGLPNYLIWECSIPGEAKTPWRDARYRLTLTFIAQHILPMVRFHVPLYHPNVDRWGYMKYQWKDVVGEPHDIKNTLTTIQRMLSHPDLTDDTHTEARDLFIYKPDLYHSQARLQVQMILEEETETRPTQENE